MQDLWQVHYQILLIISQKEFIKLNVKTANYFLEIESAKDNLIKHKCLPCNKDYSSKLYENLEKVI